MLKYYKRRCRPLIDQLYILYSKYVCINIIMYGTRKHIIIIIYNIRARADDDDGMRPRTRWKFIGRAALLYRHAAIPNLYIFKQPCVYKICVSISETRIHISHGSLYRYTRVVFKFDPWRIFSSATTVNITERRTKIEKQFLQITTFLLFRPRLRSTRCPLMYGIMPVHHCVYRCDRDEG